MLQGSLENFALDEVLGLLSSTSKTGQLAIKGDRGSGSLQFRNGRLVDGEASYTANGTGVGDVMFELLRYSEGNFTFTAMDVEPTEDDEDVASVLAAAENRLLDWRSIETVVPTLNHIVTPVADLPAEEVTISRAEWSALTIIAAGCPALVVCERLNLGEVEGSRQIKNLAERQLVVISEPTSNRRPPTPPAPPTLAGVGYPGNTPYQQREQAAVQPPAPPIPPPANMTPPSPAEISEFGSELTDASELLEEAETSTSGNGLLMQYLKQEG